MEKKYIVRLSQKERDTLTDVRKRLKGSPQKVRRAEILLKADVRGPNWTDKMTAEASSCRVQTIVNLRKRLVIEGFEIALNGKTREKPPRQKVLDGKQEAQVIAMRLGKPPKGYANWSLRLLAERVVELGAEGIVTGCLNADRKIVGAGELDGLDHILCGFSEDHQ